jgi:hypothetical protein
MIFYSEGMGTHCARHTPALNDAAWVSAGHILPIGNSGGLR